MDPLGTDNGTIKTATTHIIPAQGTAWRWWPVFWLTLAFDNTALMMLVMAVVIVVHHRCCGWGSSHCASH